MIKIINYTPHDVIIRNDDGFEIKRYCAESGRVARLQEDDTIVQYMDTIPVKEKRYKEIVGLPAETPGVYYIVSLLILQANQCQSNKRIDLIAPDTGSGVVRNIKGEIVGTKNFITLGSTSFPIIAS